MKSFVAIVCLVLCVSQVLSLRIRREAEEEETSEKPDIVKQEVLKMLVKSFCMKPQLNIFMTAKIVTLVKEIEDLGGEIDEEIQNCLDSLKEKLPVKDEASAATA